VQILRKIRREDSLDTLIDQHFHAFIS
jgi:hypothetical protein